jgi:curved DNA-binding protein CbpA
MTALIDPYSVLQVSATADVEVIQAAYRVLAHRHHPDHSDDPAASQRMAELNAAWDILKDATRRADYDKSLREGGSATTASAPAGPATRATATSESRATATGANRATATGANRATDAANSQWRSGPNGEGAAGPPPGRPSGSVLTFGRHIGWSLGEIARVDPGYLEWLKGTSTGSRYRAEIDEILRRRNAHEERMPPPRARQRAPRFGFGGR